MSFYIGGDTQEFEFDFFTKTANSVVGCPMKIYKGEVDPDNLPSPTEPLWKEITSQSIIDKLKEQNEITTSNLATDRSTIQWGDKTLTKTNVIKIVDDFKGKISGSVVENPNIWKYGNASASTKLLLPSDANFIEQAGYNQITTLNNDYDSSTVNVNGQIPQHLFSFNLIEIVERKYGSIPKETVAEKVQWLKDNLYSVSCDWYGYGSCPSGNKAMLMCWYDSMSSWNTTTKQTHNASTPTLLRSTRRFAEDQQGYDMIDNNGFIHYLAYTDPSDGVTPSTICTDYISIELTLKLPETPTKYYDFYTDSNNRRDAGLTNIVVVKRPIGDITSDFSGKVAGSVVENPNIFCPNTDYTILKPPSDYFETSNYTNLSTLDGHTRESIINAEARLSVQCFKFNLIAIAEKQLGTSIPGTDTDSKVQWLRDNLSNIKLDWHGYGSCPSGYKANTAIFRYVWEGATSGWGGWSNSSSSPTVLKRNFDIQDEYWNKIIQPDGFVYFIAYTDASDGVTPSAIYTDYVKITLVFKTDTTGYNYFTNESAEISVTTDNKASAFLIECDLTPIANSLYGGSNSALKSALKSIEANVWAMGSGANGNELGYGVNIITWINGANTWGGAIGKSTTSNIKKLTVTRPTQGDCSYAMTTANKMYWLVHTTYKSNGVIPSEVNLDYVNIKVKLARTPDVIPTITIELGDTWSILLKGFSPSWDNNNIAYLATVFGIIGDNNKFILRVDKTHGLYITWVNNKGEWLSFTIQNDIINKYNVFNILIQKKYDSINALCLKNNNEIISVDNKEAYTSVPSKSYVLGILQTYTNNYQASAFLDSVHLFNNKTFTDEEAEILLRGRNTIDTSNEYYNELAEQFKNPIIQTGYILPNNRYVITGQAKLYCNGYYTRTVQDCEFITTEKENKIELIGTAEVTRLD